MDSDDLIFTEDVIRLFGGKITSHVIYSFVREKKLPAMKVGKRWLFSKKKVQALIAKNLGVA